MSSHLFFCLPRLLPLFTVTCKMILARADERETCPYHFSLYLFTMVRRSSCGPIPWWILARTSSIVAWPLYEMRRWDGLYSPLKLCCEGPWFTSIQEDWREKGVRQSYLGTERDTPVILNWSQRCQCYSRLCHPGEHLGLEILVIYNWAKVFEDFDCLKLLSVYFNLCVDVTGVVCHKLGLLGTDLHAVGCGGFVKTFN